MNLKSKHRPRDLKRISFPEIWMDLTYSDRENQFRAEARAWLEDNFPKMP